MASRASGKDRKGDVEGRGRRKKRRRRRKEEEEEEKKENEEGMEKGRGRARCGAANVCSALVRGGARRRGEGGGGTNARGRVAKRHIDVAKRLHCSKTRTVCEPRVSSFVTACQCALCNVCQSAVQRCATSL